MTYPSKLTAISVAAVAGCLLASGCSGSSKHAAAGSTASAAATGGSATAAAVASTGAGSPTASAPAAVTTSTAATSSSPKVTCQQLTTAEIQPLVKDPVTRVAVTPGATDGNGQTCNWGTVGTSSAVSITVLSGTDATNTYASDLASMSTPVTIPGVGDKAVRDKGESFIVISMKGGTYCRVNDDQQVPGIAALEDAAGNSANIGDANYAIADAAEATLCNRIYGSGTTTFDISALKAPSALAAASAAATNDALPTNFSLPTDSAPAAS